MHNASARPCYLGDHRGGVSVAFGILLPVLLGIAALSVDIGLWLLSRRQAQTAVDAAAIGAAHHLLFSDGVSAIEAARRSAAQNGFPIQGVTTMALHNPPVSGAYAGNITAVEVILNVPQTAGLSRIIFPDLVTVSVRAVAAATIVGEACILALDTTATQAVKIWGNSSVDATGCVIGANSNSSSAIALGGDAVLNADSLWTAGGIDQGSNASVTLAKSAISNATTLADPYADISATPTGTCIATRLDVNDTRTLVPGRYCNGLSFGAQAQATLEPGTYYIDRGDLTINAGAAISCNCPAARDSVTIVLTGASGIGSVTINGGASVSLRAPSAEGAAFEGIIIFQDMNAASNGTNRLNGGSEMYLTGALYFPRQHVQFSGGTTVGGPNCTQIIARTVEFSGNSHIDNTGCDELGVKSIQVQGVALME